MGLFWRRKSGDEFVRLGLNEPAKTKEKSEEATRPEPLSSVPAVLPSASGSGPTPTPIEPTREVESARPVAQPESATTVKEKPVPTRSPFATSVLGLNLSMEELQAQ